jgi:hypothetical protein
MDEKKRKCPVIPLKTGSKKEGENVGKSNTVDYIIKQRGIEPRNLATRRRNELPRSRADEVSRNGNKVLPRCRASRNPLIEVEKPLKR